MKWLGKGCQISKLIKEKDSLRKEIEESDSGEQLYYFQELNTY